MFAPRVGMFSSSAKMTEGSRKGELLLIGSPMRSFKTPLSERMIGQRVLTRFPYSVSVIMHRKRLSTSDRNA